MVHFEGVTRGLPCSPEQNVQLAFLAQIFTISSYSVPVHPHPLTTLGSSSHWAMTLAGTWLLSEPSLSSPDLLCRVAHPFPAFCFLPGLVRGPDSSLSAHPCVGVRPATCPRPRGSRQPAPPTRRDVNRSEPQCHHVKRRGASQQPSPYPHTASRRTGGQKGPSSESALCPQETPSPSKPPVTQAGASKQGGCRLGGGWGPQPRCGLGPPPPHGVT